MSPKFRGTLMFKTTNIALLIFFKKTSPKVFGALGITVPSKKHLKKHSKNQLPVAGQRLPLRSTTSTPRSSTATVFIVSGTCPKRLSRFLVPPVFHSFWVWFKTNKNNGFLEKSSDGFSLLVFVWLKRQKEKGERCES